MNNTARGILFGLFLLGSFVLGYAALVTSSSDSADGQRAVLPLSAGTIACAVIASGAMSGMGGGGSSSQNSQVTFGGRGAVAGPPDPQPYGQQQPYGGTYGQPPQGPPRSGQG